MKKTLVSLSLAMLLSACASSFDSKNALEHWNCYHKETISNIKPTEQQAIVVFYRTDETPNDGVNIYVNTDYQVSLLERGFSPVAVCANKPLFSASAVSNERFGNRTDGVRYNLKKGEVNYVKVVRQADRHFAFEMVSEDVAKADFTRLKGEVRHNLPRVTKQNHCEGDKVVLSASALWGLDKFSYADMLPQGKQEIAAFAEFVKGSTEIASIEVKGFTDPEASEAYNQQLSERRANTVKQALTQAGVSLPIKAVGYGETELVIADCDVKHATDRKARAACNLPNRRVEITTYGGQTK